MENHDQNNIGFSLLFVQKRSRGGSCMLIHYIAETGRN